MDDHEKLLADAKDKKPIEDEKSYTPLTLPSGGCVYPKDTVVKIRTLKVKDERIITDMDDSNYELKLQHLMRQVIVGVNPDTMTLGDRLYCLCWLRIFSYTKYYNVELPCPLCKEKVAYAFDLSKLPIRDLPKDFKEPLNVDLPIAGKSVAVKLARVSDEISIANYSRDAGMNPYIVRYAATLVGEQFKKLADKVQFCMDLDVKDFAAIKRVNDEIGDHGPEFTQEFVCPKCGGSEAVRLPFQLEFFIAKSNTVGAT